MLYYQLVQDVSLTITGCCIISWYQKKDEIIKNFGEGDSSIISVQKVQKLIGLLHYNLPYKV